MKTIENNKKCTGCGVCAFACPTKAIKMTRDDLGFLIPVVDREKCVSCGKCVSLCHTYHTEGKNEILSPYVLCGWHKSNDIRLASSSGGAFTAIAEQVLAENGVVYAHVFCPENKIVQCKRIESTDGLQGGRTSKYVESDMTGGVLCEIKEDLGVNRTVLFTGTPCQTAAIEKAFGDNERLITISLLCHGVSSPLAFQRYLQEIENGYQVTSVNFRHKILGWHDCTLQIKFANGKAKYCHYSTDPYYYCDMVKSLFLRDSCYACQYHKGHNSDMTIGDFWNVTGEAKVVDDNKGISLMIANTEAGKQLLLRAKDRMVTYELSKKDIQYAFWDSSNCDISGMTKKRSDFMKAMQENGFVKAARSQMGHRGIPEIKVAMKYVLRGLHLW